MVPCQVFIRLSGRKRHVKVIVASIRITSLAQFAVADGLHDDVCGNEARFFCAANQEACVAELVLVEEQTRAKNRLQKWITVYFPESKGIYTHIDAKGGLLVLKRAATPGEIVQLGVDGIDQIWREAPIFSI